MDDITDTGRWLTYDELATLRGIKRIGAVRLVQRRKWRRQAGNDGLARVLVPHNALEPVRRTDAGISSGTGRPTGAPGISSPTDAGTSSLAAAGTVTPDIVERLVAQVDEANKRADVAVVLADRSLAQLAEANTRASEAEKALVGERHRADQVEIAVDRLEAELEAERTARGEAEADAAELRDRMAKNMEAAEAELRQAEGAVHKAEHDRIAAVAIADEAVRAADALRQAEEQRRGQGRWQRLRAAWLNRR